MQFDRDTATSASYIQRGYMLSELAHTGLYARLLPPTILSEEAYITDDGAVRHTTIQQHKEGISHALNTYAKLSLDVWMDTRPQSIVQGHLALQTYTGACRFPWYYQPLPPDPDDPLELVPSTEEQLSLPSRRKRRTLRLTPPARVYYAELAKLHKMETHSGAHSLGNYISAALEAIGIGWLSLPSDLYQLPPNHNKLRPGFGSPSNTDHLRPWEMTRAELEEVSKHGYSRIHQAESDEGTGFEV